MTFGPSVKPADLIATVEQTGYTAQVPRPPATAGPAVADPEDEQVRRLRQRLWVAPWDGRRCATHDRGSERSSQGPAGLLEGHHPVITGVGIGRVYRCAEPAVLALEVLLRHAECAPAGLAH